MGSISPIFTNTNFANAETPTGTQNGINKTYTLSSTPNPPSSLQLYYNGMLLAAGGVDYTLTGNTIVLVALTPNSGAGDVFTAFYRY